MKKLQLGMVALLASTVSLSATAASVTGAFTNGQQQWSDDSGEVLVDNDSSGDISVGDYLVGVLGITSFPTTGVPANSVNELTAVFATEVTSVVAINPIACGGAVITSCSGFEFGAVAAGFNAAIAAADAITGATSPVFANVDADTVAVWLEDGTTAFDRDGGTVANGFNTGTDGTERLTVGLLAGDTWTGTGPTDVAEFFLVASGVNVGGFGVTGSITYQDFAGYNFDPLITASGNLKPSSVSQFVITDDATFEVTINKVPEPSAVALFGLGLLGFGASTIRRRK